MILWRSLSWGSVKEGNASQPGFTETHCSKFDGYLYLFKTNYLETFLFSLTDFSLVFPSVAGIGKERRAKFELNAMVYLEDSWNLVSVLMMLRINITFNGSRDNSEKLVLQDSNLYAWKDIYRRYTCEAYEPTSPNHWSSSENNFIVIKNKNSL